MGLKVECSLSPSIKNTAHIRIVHSYVSMLVIIGLLVTIELTVTILQDLQHYMHYYIQKQTS